MIPPSSFRDQLHEDVMPKAALPCAVFLLATALWGPGASAQLRTGAEAYGDFTQDAPGVRRHITPADLPAPFATKGVPNMSSMVPEPAGILPKVPAGITVELF